MIRRGECIRKEITVAKKEDMVMVEHARSIIGIVKAGLISPSVGRLSKNTTMGIITMGIG